MDQTILGALAISFVSGSVGSLEPFKGGTAQWQSIRLQIERSPVQIRLPPLDLYKVLLFLHTVFKSREPPKNVTCGEYDLHDRRDMQNQRFLKSLLEDTLSFGPTKVDPA